MKSENNNKKIRIGLIDLKIHNLFSLYKSLSFLKYQVTIINNKSDYKKFDIIFLPGVGAFNTAMRKIKNDGIDDKLKNFITNKNKLLFGICLGMQLFFDKSNEFKETKGLGLIRGSVTNFPNKRNIKIPNIGWSKLIKKNNKSFFKNLTKKDYFYFIHSYYCRPENNNFEGYFSKTYNFEFCSSIKKDNIIATQFHPEKSGKSGIKILSDLSCFI